MIYVDGRITKNFTVAEIANNSANDLCKLVFTPELVSFAALLQTLRDQHGKPLKVNSWYRTAEFNRRVGGSSNSLHLQGRAVDLDVSSHSEQERLVKLWREICLANNRIGGANLYPSLIHLDDFENFFGNDSFVLRIRR